MAKNNSRCGCNSCGDCNNCASNFTGFNSRGCGALHHLGRSSYTNCNGCNNCNNWGPWNNWNNSSTWNTWNTCNGCNSCGNGWNNWNNWRNWSNRRGVNSDWPCATTCSGSPLFYTGPCGCAGNCCNNCNGCCNNCGNCNCCGNCNNCNGCGNCCDPCNSCDPCCDDCTGSAYGRAAEFTAVAPQCESSGGALNFREGSCGCDSFEVCHGGVRINRCGRYVAMYSFAAPAGSNAATTLCLSHNGREMDSSRAFVGPATTSHYRQAHGQAIFEADAGDVISLNTSSALSIPDCACHSPIASLILMEADS